MLTAIIALTLALCPPGAHVVTAEISGATLQGAGAFEADGGDGTPRCTADLHALRCVVSTVGAQPPEVLALYIPDGPDRCRDTPIVLRAAVDGAALPERALGLVPAAGHCVYLPEVSHG